MSKHPFKTEAELCAAYIEFVQRGGRWTAYPETEGWDILLVRNADGFQIGIQAKMAFNTKVLAQALEGGFCAWRASGPDCRAVLVPTCPAGAGDVCLALGITLIHYLGGHRGDFSPQRMPGELGYPAGSDWPEWSPDKRHPLPAYVPDVTAGSSAPVQLTRWKIGALKVLALLHLRGHVTRADLKDIGIDARRWIGGGCIGYLDPADGGRWVASSRMPDFEKQHPVVFPQVLEEMAAQLGKVAL